jgi:hypothetical protein
MPTEKVYVVASADGGFEVLDSQEAADIVKGWLIERGNYWGSDECVIRSLEDLAHAD